MSVRPRQSCVAILLSGLLSGCFAPGAESDDQGLPSPVSYSFYLPEQDLPATAVVSDEDVEGLALPTSETELLPGAARVQFSFRSTQLSFNGQPDGEYCLVNDIVIVDGRTGEESIGVPAGSCFEKSWTHPEAE